MIIKRIIAKIAKDKPKIMRNHFFDNPSPVRASGSVLMPVIIINIPIIINDRTTIAIVLQFTTHILTSSHYYSIGWANVYHLS